MLITAFLGEFESEGIHSDSWMLRRWRTAAVACMADYRRDRYSAEALISAPVMLALVRKFEARPIAPQPHLDLLGHHLTAIALQL